jgi:hypothetical protein
MCFASMFPVHVFRSRTDYTILAVRDGGENINNCISMSTPLCSLLFYTCFKESLEVLFLLSLPGSLLVFYVTFLVLNGIVLYFSQIHCGFLTFATYIINFDETFEILTMLRKMQTNNRHYKSSVRSEDEGRWMYCQNFS